MDRGLNGIRLVPTVFGTLVRVEKLIDHLDDPEWRVVDCRHDLADPEFGRNAYRDGHIPGALFMHLDEDLSGPMTGRNGRHPLPEPGALATRLGTLGIDRDKQVVAYDDAGGVFAARLWWLLRWLGHEGVAVLDGGYRAWCDAALPLDTGTSKPPQTVFAPAPEPADVVDVDFVASNLRRPDILILDARSPDRYRGENEKLDPVGGHIPGAVNRFFRDNLVSGGRFKNASQLRSEYSRIIGDKPPTEIIHQCGSGVTACHNLLAMEYVGLHGSRLYAGSWSEWCADPARPIATGDQA